MAGCCDCFKLNRKTMIENLSDAIDYSELSSGIDESFISVPTIKEMQEFSNNELVNIEKELYGFYLSNHPVTKYNNSIKLININNYFDKNIKLFLYVEKIKVINTKKNEEMAFLNCSDETNNMDFIVFPSKFNLIRELKSGDIVEIFGKVERRYDKYQILVNDIKKVLE